MKIKRLASIIIFASLSITHVVNSQMLPREDLNSSSELQQMMHDILKKLGENALSIQKTPVLLCASKVVENKHYIADRLKVTLANLSNDNLAKIRSLDHYLKSSNGKSLLIAFQYSLSISSLQKIKERDDKLAQLMQAANPPAKINQDLNYFLTIISNTNTVDLMNKYFKSSGGSCSKISLSAI